MAYRAPRLLKATAERLRDDLGITSGARELAGVLRAAERSSEARKAEDALDLVNDAMNATHGGAFGVEVIRGHEYHGGFWGDAVAAYVNTGEAYNATVVYDVGRDTFYACSWGDWVEDYEWRTGETLP